MSDGVQADAGEQIRIVVPAGQSKERIDIYLTHRIENATRNKVQKGIEEGFVLVNGKRVRSSYTVLPHDIIDITLPHPPRPEAIPENIPLDIVFEDDVLLVVNKPAGMVTHPAYGHYSGTLVNALLYHCNILSRSNTELRPGIVHRLDKDTSGLLVVAKNDSVHAALARQFARHTIEREYWALIWGAMRKERGSIEANLGRSKKDRKKVAVTEKGKFASTDYEMLEKFGFLSLVKLRLNTGRTHQIRVHLSHVGHPVFGDPAYGGRSNTWGGLSAKRAQQAANLLKLCQRQALHAKTLGFVHPTTKTKVMFDTNLPEDISAVLKELAE